MKWPWEARTFEFKIIFAGISSDQVDCHWQG